MNSSILNCENVEKLYRNFLSKKEIFWKSNLSLFSTMLWFQWDQLYLLDRLKLLMDTPREKQYVKSHQT